MNIHFGNQSQFELFPKTTGDTIENVAPRFIFSRVVLTFENLVVVFVFVIVSLVIAYSIGVERGRRNTAVARPVAQVTPEVALTIQDVTHPRIELTPPPAAARPLTTATSTAEAARALPPKTVPVVPKTSSEKVVDKGYTVQVASYKSQADARQEAKVLRDQGFDSMVLTKGSYSILCVGRFAQQDGAKDLQNKLRKKYKDSLIRSF